MQSLQDIVPMILTQPTPEALVVLQGGLLARLKEGEPVAQALELASHFFEYLCELQSKITARQYSELASLLDIGAVGAVALENMLFSEGGNSWQGFLLGAAGEGLMVAASRQYIKAWQAETGPVHTCAAWYLTEALWHASSEMRPELEEEKRWQAIQALLAPAYDPDVPAPEKAVLLGRVFQMMLATYLARLVTTGDQD